MATEPTAATGDGVPDAHSGASADFAVVVSGLRMAYGGVEAVRGVDLRVGVGGVFALLGPNGAGKTSTVEILEGYRRRTGGEVSVLGVDPARGGAEFRARIGVVLQECAIDPYLTVREVLCQRAAYYPAPRGVAEVIELVGLQGKAGARVKVLSGGQQRRLDLALGLIGDPELLFLDEPTTGFDPSARRHAWEVIAGLGQLGKTIVLTTHYMDEAQALATEVAVIAAGQIVATGPPDSLGDRDHAAHTVRFRLSGPPPEPLPDQLHGRLQTDQDSPGGLVVHTSHPTEDLHTLTGWAVNHGLTLEQLSVTQPSLEDIYLQLTGPTDTPEP